MTSQVLSQADEPVLFLGKTKTFSTYMIKKVNEPHALKLVTGPAELKQKFLLLEVNSTLLSPQGPGNNRRHVPIHSGSV